MKHKETYYKQKDNFIAFEWQMNCWELGQNYDMQSFKDYMLILSGVLRNWRETR